VSSRIFNKKPSNENTSRDLVPFALKNLFASGGGQPSLLPEIAENFPLSIDQLEYLQKLKESDPSLIILPLILIVIFLFFFICFLRKWTHEKRAQI
jgi:hypothetical protein